jgi:hypothetical protein
MKNSDMKLGCGCLKQYIKCVIDHVVDLHASCLSPGRYRYF